MHGQARPDHERQVEPAATELAREAVAVAEDRRRALAALGELDALELPRFDVAHAVADAQPERPERAGHEEAVAIAHERPESAVARGRARRPEGELRDALDRHPF